MVVILDIFQQGLEDKTIQEALTTNLALVTYKRYVENSHKRFKHRWIPLIGPKIRKKLRKTGCKVIFTSAAKLKNILCNNKSKLLPNSYPGVFELSCDCGGKYFEEPKKISTHSLSIEHQEVNMIGKWVISGATEHSKYRHGWFI